MCYGFDVKLWHAICWYSVFEWIDFLTFLCIWFEIDKSTSQLHLLLFWLIFLLDLGSSFWGMALILASTNLLTAKIAAGCFIAALIVVLFLAKNVRLIIDGEVLYQYIKANFVLTSLPFHVLLHTFIQKVDTSRTVYWWVVLWSSSSQIECEKVERWHWQVSHWHFSS